MSSEASSSSSKDPKAEALNNKMLALIIKQLPDKSLDWEAIASGMPVTATGNPPTVAATRERWRRYRIANGMIEVKPKATDTEAGSGTKPASAAKGKSPAKRKSPEDGETNNTDGEVVTPVKKVARKRKTPLSASKIKESEDGNRVESENEVVSPAKKVKSTPKKAAAATKKATPSKGKAVKKEPVIEEEAGVGTNPDAAPGDEDLVASSDHKEVETPELIKEEEDATIEA